MNFAERIKELRESEKLTKKQFAKVLNVDIRTVRSWEEGLRLPNGQMIIRICRTFKVTANFLLGI